MDITFPQPIEIFAGTSGINNLVDTASIEDTDLVSCTNFLIDEYGFPYTLFKSELVSAGAFIQTPQDPTLPYVVAQLGSGLAIYYVNEDLTLTGVRNGMSASKFSFTKHGSHVYYTNGFDNGRLQDSTSFLWPKVTKDSKDLRVFSEAPVGQHIENYLGLCVVSLGQTLYFSLDPSKFELHADFLQFSAQITMVRRVPTGLFVSTTESVYFIQGALTGSSVPRLVCNTPALEWSDSAELIDGTDLGVDYSGQGVVWVSTDAVCVGLSSGEVKKINKHKIRYPVSLGDVSSFIINKTFIHSF